MSGRGPEDRLGQRVGDYVLERMLGRGGMSTVFFAREHSTGRPAALKLLHSDLPDNISAGERLEQEARAIARIDHPHVVRVFDWGQTTDGLPFIAMEYLEGQSLSQLLTDIKPVPLPRMLDIADQMLDAIDKAHSLDIIHRDIKPDNVLLVSRDGRRDFVKMLDFGIAKLLGTHPHSLVQTVRGVVLGTPEYLPPEIAMDLSVSPATDIYAMGVILFEGLTGRLPFTGRGPGELAEHHCFTPPPRLRAFNRELPVELEKMVLRCLAKEPIDRYQSAAELRGALAGLVGGGMQPTRTVVSVPLGPSDNDDTAELDAVEKVLRDEVMRRWHDRTLPTALARSLGELEDLRRKLEAVGTELALLADHLSELASATLTEERALAQAQGEHETARDALRELQRQDLHLETDLAEAEARARERLALAFELPMGSELSTIELQGVLDYSNLELLTAQLNQRGQTQQLGARRAELLKKLVAQAERVAELQLEMGDREAELTRARARQQARRRRLEARRRTLQAEESSYRREVGHLLMGCLLDVAVAVGVG